MAKSYDWNTPIREVIEDSRQATYEALVKPNSFRMHGKVVSIKPAPVLIAWSEPDEYN